jgi:hypothetical protein
MCPVHRLPGGGYEVALIAVGRRRFRNPDLGVLLELTWRASTGVVPTFHPVPNYTRKLALAQMGRSLGTYSCVSSWGGMFHVEHQ